MKIPFFSMAIFALLLSACCIENKSEGRWTVEKLNDSIYYVMNVGGKLAYLSGVDNANGTKFYYIYEGKDLGADYDKIDLDLYDINGKPAFFARDDNKSFIVYDGKEYGKEYDYVDPIFTSVAGEITYFAIKDKKSFIVRGEKEIGREYDQTASSFGINESELSGHDQEKIMVRYDAEGRPAYQLIMPAFGDVNGKLAYVAEKDGKSFIVYDGQEIGKQYDRVYSHITVGNHTYLKPVNGKLTYLALKDNKTFIVYDGREMGKGNYTVDPFYVIGVGGKLAFAARRDNKTFIVYEGGETGKEYDEIGSLLVYDGKLTYIAVEGGRSFVVHDRDESTGGYDSVTGVSMLNGKLVYMVTSDLKTFFVYDGVEIGREYDDVDSVTEIDGKIIYTAWKDNIHYLVKEN
jgi:hypothetical protein